MLWLAAPMSPAKSQLGVPQSLWECTNRAGGDGGVVLTDNKHIVCFAFHVCESPVWIAHAYM